MAHYRLSGGVLTVVGALALWRLRRVEVVGTSMHPTLDAGDRLVVWRSPRARPGDLVTLPDPRGSGRVVVKRVMSVDAASVVVAGDNAEASTDSRTFGPVPAKSIQARVLYRYHPADRRGRPCGGLRSR